MSSGDTTVQHPALPWVPRLVELHMVSDDDTEITPAGIKAVPVRRLTKAAAQFISLSEHGVGVPDYDPTTLLRPDHEPGRRKLDDAHYDRVAKLLVYAREIGLPPRDFVAQQLGATLPTLDRWIREAKRRKFLPRNWATTESPTTTTTDEETRP